MKFIYALAENLWMPKSRTYWMGIFLILCGLLEFVDGFYSLGIVGVLLRALYGLTTPFMLILGGSIVVTGRASINSLVNL